MNRTHRLSLRRETLTELTANELGLVAGGEPGDPQPTPPIWAITYACPTNYCVPFTNACPTTLC